MRQKAGIIQAFMENQDFILLDEPTRGLDTASIQAFNELIKKSIQANKTNIIAAHDTIDELQFDRKYELKDGILNITNFINIPTIIYIFFKKYRNLQFNKLLSC